MDEAAMTSPKVVLLDRDGVINRDRPGSVLAAADFELIPGSLAALIALTRAGWQVAIVTNQACIGRGAVAAAVVDGIHAELSAQVVAGAAFAAGAGAQSHPLHFFVSASADPADPDRKPNPGLIQRAHAALAFERASTWLVGDDKRDVLAARAGGVRPALVLTGKGTAAHAALPDVPVFADLQTFATALIEGSLV